MKRNTKNRNLFLLACMALTLAGCSKEDSVSTPSFDVALPTTTFKVGEPIRFSLSGDPDFILFYSGENGNEYEYKDKDRVTPASMSMSFTQTTSSGTPGYANPAYAPISYSTDFDGDYTEEGVRRATWIDLSDNFKFPTDVPQTGVPSGTLDITNLFPAKDKPIYFRFHYLVKKFDSSIAGGKGNGRTQVNIQNFFVDGVTEAGSAHIYDLLTMKWRSVLTASFEGATSVPDMPGNSVRILLRSEFQPPQDRECWAVSGPILPADDINTGPDMAVGIKAVADPTMTSWEHIYKKPGTYTVTFVGANSNTYGRKEEVRQIKITVVDDGGSIAPPTHKPWES